MTHLTCTGFDAGRPLCDVNKEEATKAGDTFVHAMYANLNKIPDCCPKCRDIWEDEEGE